MTWMHRMLPTVLLVSACSAANSADSPVERGWQRLRTDHFTLTTDLEPALAQRAASSLEVTRAALLEAGWPRLGTTRQTQRVRVVVLKDRLEFGHYFGTNVSGLHVGGRLQTIVLYGAPEQWEERDRTGRFATSKLRHELSHYLAAGIYTRLPRWFNEGLAEFMSAMVISESDGQAQLGRGNFEAMSNYLGHRSVRVEDALAWDTNDRVESTSTLLGLYGTSWMLVQWMYNAQPDRFSAYQRALADGIDPERAWAEQFGGPEFERLDETLFHFARYGQIAVDRVNLRPIRVEPVPLAITAADVYALRAQLAYVGFDLDATRDDLSSQAEREVALALTLEPGHAVALRLWLRTQKIERTEFLSRLREQTRRRPDDGDAWLMMGSRLEGAEAEAAYRKAIALLPGDATAYNDLARFLAQSGRGTEALPMATKAAYLAPWDPDVLDTYAACLFLVGRCSDALRWQRRAIDFIPEQFRNADSLQPFTSALAHYERSCSRNDTAGETGSP